MSSDGPAAPPWRYRLLIRLAAPLILLHLALRSLRDGGWRYGPERLGAGRAVPPGCRWIHAASVGEVLTVLPLLDALQQAEPDRPVLVTTTTPTGAAVLQQRTGDNVLHRYLPIDWPGACRRFLRRTAPTSAWIVETEIWPWLYACCRHEQIGLSIVNARLSPRTMAAATGWLQPVYQRALTGVSILARSEADADRYRALGAADHLLCVPGNLKFAASRHPQQARPPLQQTYCIAASTHEDEERQLAAEWLQRPQGLLVIVPRHPERGDRIHAQLDTVCREAGVPGCARRSLDGQPGAGDRLYLADTLGELQDWFSGAGAVFMGGSLVPRGGHNLLEPARQGCALVTGPHTLNFTDAVELLTAHSAVLCAGDAAEAVTQLHRLLNNPSQAAALGQRARAAVSQQAGVADDYLRCLLATGESSA